MIDLSGQQFGEWTVIKYAGRRGPTHYRWLCRCSCGTEKEVRRSNLIDGSSKHCGHSVGDRVRKHGLYESPVYKIWSAMKRRCFKPTCQEFKNYGARGITVCERWLKFENFFADMGHPPPKYTLERKDNNGPYSPENCLWANRHQQARNYRRNRWITFNGETLVITDWAARIGIGLTAFKKRLKRWPIEKALTFHKVS
jgi:hypothetical protein